MHQNPLVSVLIVSMNHGKYIEQSINSILNQTYRNLEIIYIDNNSSDDSYSKGIGLLNSDTRFKSGTKNDSNISLPANLNNMIRKSSGKYISMISADDWFDLSNIEEKVKFAESNPSVAVVYGSGKYYFEDSNQYKSVPVIEPDPSNFFQQLLNNNFIFPVGALIKKSIFDELGYYDENLSVEDWDMWLRISRHYPIGFQNKELVFYRRHSSNFSGTLSRKILVDMKKVMKIYMPYNKHPLRTWSYYLKLKLVYMNNPLINLIIRIIKNK